MRPLTFCLAALALLAALPAASQERLPEEGARVRVAPSWRVSGSHWIVGTVVASDPDSLTVLRADTREPFTVHRRDINTLQVSAGHEPTLVTVARYAVIGAAAGATTGALLGAALHRKEDTYFGRQGAALIGAVVVGFPSYIIGGVVGWGMSGERWVGVPVTPTAAVSPGGGVGVALSLKL